MSQTYTPEQIKQMKTFEAMMQFHDIKEGDKITGRQVEAMNYLFGDVFRKMKLVSTTIKFDEKGAAYTEGGNPFGISVDGKELPNKEVPK